MGGVGAVGMFIHVHLQAVATMQAEGYGNIVYPQTYKLKYFSGLEHLAKTFKNLEVKKAWEPDICLASEMQEDWEGEKRRTNKG